MACRLIDFGAAPWQPGAHPLERKKTATDAAGIRPDSGLDGEPCRASVRGVGAGTRRAKALCDTP